MRHRTCASQSLNSKTFESSLNALTTCRCPCVDMYLRHPIAKQSEPKVFTKREPRGVRHAYEGRTHIPRRDRIFSDVSFRTKTCIAVSCDTKMRDWTGGAEDTSPSKYPSLHKDHTERISNKSTSKKV